MINTSPFIESETPILDSVYGSCIRVRVAFDQNKELKGGYTAYYRPDQQTREEFDQWLIAKIDKILERGTPPLIGLREWQLEQLGS